MYITKSFSVKQHLTVFTVHHIYWHSTFTDFVVQKEKQYVALGRKKNLIFRLLEACNLISNILSTKTEFLSFKLLLVWITADYPSTLLLNS